MKKIILITAGLMALGFVAAQAGTFAAIDPAHPQTSVGVFNDFKGHYDGGAVVVLISQKSQTQDLLAYIINGWAPLTLGGTTGRGLGGPSVALGTGFNVIPAARTLALVAWESLAGKGDISLHMTTPAAASAETPSAELFIGPQYSWVFDSLKKSHACPTLYIGASIKF